MSTQTNSPAWTQNPPRPGPPVPGAPGGDRLPVPTRQRRPAFAALAIVLILAGAAISGLLVIRSGQKVGVLVLNKDVTIGQQFARGDFKIVQMSYPGDVQPVQENQLNQLINDKYRAVSDLPTGTVLTTKMISKNTPVPGDDYASIGLTVPLGQYPSDLRPGDRIKVVYTPKTGSNQNSIKLSNDPRAQPAVAGQTIVPKALVTDVRAPESGSGSSNLLITVVVQNVDANGRLDNIAGLAAANALQAITIYRLPEDTEVETGSGQ